ncbi:MAG TPA: MEDS domain-containing protein [Candidatus Saccharimonadales bacterium]|nr:MEDS domain-containing protein [Candidatus Saccharimonadales bacterium]
MRNYAEMRKDIFVNSKLHWFSAPTPKHVVHFYPHETDLFASLNQYIGAGLVKGETCIVVATGDHLRHLDVWLASNSIDITLARKTGQYVTLDATRTLSSFMEGDLPDRDRFFEVVGSAVAKAAAKGQPIRAFGEMVALLWKDGNKDAVIRLETLWNGLAEVYTISLYCAYPDLHFIMDKDARSEIRTCHNVQLQR